MNSKLTYTLLSRGLKLLIGQFQQPMIAQLHKVNLKSHLEYSLNKSDIDLSESNALSNINR